ncbi:hypothetical protein TIFTF001_026506 [Ficus carica]|uniref:Uncharacterized protein n=1 Tax=Ficus carica TaxID=3494 RepID=A0AA88IY62_FICCA|nr:hypothetical protein TIFTF001_026506 [Ficus carica]
MIKLKEDGLYGSQPPTAAASPASGGFSPPKVACLLRRRVLEKFLLKNELVAKEIESNEACAEYGPIA